MNISTVFSTIDTHVAGEAYRIIVYSSIILDKPDIKENNQVLHQVYQDECDFLLNEPRGHKGMHGCVVLPSKKADFGLLLFAHHKESLFSYSGLIGAVTALLETGKLQRTDNDNYTVETIYGIYQVQATVQNEKVTSILLKNSGSRSRKQLNVQDRGRR
jgi:proline racemase